MEGSAVFILFSYIDGVCGFGCMWVGMFGRVVLRKIKCGNISKEKLNMKTKAVENNTLLTGCKFDAISS